MIDYLHHLKNLGCPLTEHMAQAELNPKVQSCFWHDIFVSVTYLHTSQHCTNTKTISEVLFCELINIIVLRVSYLITNPLN